MGGSLSDFHTVGLRREVVGTESWRDDILTAYQDKHGLEEGFDYQAILRGLKYPFANVLSGTEIAQFHRKVGEDRILDFAVLKEDIERVMPESAQEMQVISLKSLCVASPATRPSTRVAKYANTGTIVQKERQIAQLVTAKHLGVTMSQLRAGNLWQLSEYASGLLVLHGRTLPEKDVLYRMKRIIDSKKILPENLVLKKLEIFPELEEKSGS